MEPLNRALAGAQAWIAGLRADQSAHRQDMALVTAETDRGLIKLNPLFDWTRDELLDFITANDIPVNPLHAKGFASIGCAPCTRAIAPGEPERAGRWWWEDERKKLCGLHTRRRLVGSSTSRYPTTTIAALSSVGSRKMLDPTYKPRADIKNTRRRPPSGHGPP